MCIANCLQFGAWTVHGKEPQALQVCVCASVHADSNVLAPVCPSPPAVIHFFEHRIPKINKSVQGHQKRKKTARYQTTIKEARRKSGRFTGSPTSSVMLRLQYQKALIILMGLGYIRLMIIKEAQGFFLSKNNTADRGPLSKKLDTSIEQKPMQSTCYAPLQPAASSDARVVARQTF